MQTAVPSTLRVGLIQLVAQGKRSNKPRDTNSWDSPNNSLPLRENFKTDQHKSNEQRSSQSTFRKGTIEEEETRMKTHGSTKITGL